MSPTVVSFRPPDSTATPPDPYTPLEDSTRYRRVYLNFRNAYPEWSTDQRRQFFDHIIQALIPLGFVVPPDFPDRTLAIHLADYPANRYGYTPGTAYVHPQHLSGVFSVPIIDRLMTAITAEHETLLRAVHYHEWQYRYQPEELAQALESTRTAVSDQILQRYRTARRNLYFGHEVLAAITSPVPLNRQDTTPGSNANQERAFISDVFYTLLESGALIASHNRQGKPLARTRTPRDLRRSGS